MHCCKKMWEWLCHSTKKDESSSGFMGMWGMWGWGGLSWKTGQKCNAYNGRKKDGWKERKRQTRVIDDSRCVLGKLSWSVILYLLVLWWRAGRLWFKNSIHLNGGKKSDRKTREWVWLFKSCIQAHNLGMGQESWSLFGVTAREETWQKTGLIDNSSVISCVITLITWSSVLFYYI